MKYGKLTDVDKLIDAHILARLVLEVVEKLLDFIQCVSELMIVL